MGHVLLVEDDDDLRTLWGKFLERDQHTYDAVSNGGEAVEKIRTQDREYDVVITDLLMPGMSGKDLLEEVRGQLELRTPVIVISGVHYMIEALGELQKGAFSLMKKPCEAGEMLETVKQALKLREAFVEMRRLQGRVDDLTRVRNDVMRRNKELFECSRLDPLTGLPNRVQMDALLQVFRANAVRYKSRFAVAFCDIDGFGQINREHGHTNADEVLTGTTAAIQRCCRDGDSLFRWGGDEFVLVLSEQDLEGARVAMQRILDELTATPVPLGEGGEGGGTVSVTMSVGLAAMASGETRTIQSMVDEANQYMLEAKAAGKNRIHPEATPA